MHGLSGSDQLPPTPPFFQYDTDDDGVNQKKLTSGKLPFVDPRYKERSFGERKLVELMERCWLLNPFERIDMFAAVAFLREAIQENAARSGGHYAMVAGGF